MRMGVRQRNEELCKWQSCTYNELRGVAPAGTGEMLLLFHTLQRIRKPSHWGRNSLEAVRQEHRNCSATNPSSFLHYGEQTLLMDTVTEDCQ